MNKRIVGIDICKDRGVCWTLEDYPGKLKTYWKSESKQRSKDPKKDPYTFYFNRGGVKAFLDLKPDVVALEPTGVHYAWFLGQVCEQEGIEVLWVGHQEAVSLRRQNRLPDKNDLADALALAAYGQLYYGQEEFFLQFEGGKCNQLRELYLQLKSLARIQNPIINRLRQQLAREFPEAAFKRSVAVKDCYSPLFAWLAGRERKTQRRNFYYENLYRDSVAHDYGVKLSDFSYRLANQLCDIHEWEFSLEQELKQLLKDETFDTYNQVFDKFHFGKRLRALLISQIYPFSRFDQMGRLKRRLGMAKMEESSGDKIAWGSGAGSKMCRTELYLWCVTTISIRRCRPTTEVGKKLGQFYDDWKDKFSSDPDQFRRQLLERKQAKALDKLQDQLRKSMLPLLKQGQDKVFESQLAMVTAMFQSQISQPLTDELEEGVKHGEVKKGFGNLIIGKTCGYATRLLFRELKKAFSK